MSIEDHECENCCLCTEVCGIEWDDRDDPSIPRGGGYSCELVWEHDGPHRSDTFEWRTGEP